jgi:triosephosphate isomerase (TIM)
MSGALAEPLDNSKGKKGRLKMPQRPVPLVAGNWKMNGLVAELDVIAAVRDAVQAGQAGLAEVLICPPATLLKAGADLCKGSSVALGGQDCHTASSGAHTGDISAVMLRDAGATYVIVGHSERRMDHHEDNVLVRAKAEAAQAAGLTVIICVGETLHEREAGEALPVVAAQLAGSVPENAEPGHLVIAYEPIWAIGTGLTPSPEDVAEMHGFIRSRLDRHFDTRGGSVRILYGGSVKRANARELLRIPNVDGALVGGASLKTKEFLAIAEIYK